ncbi:hypothetical protein ACFL1Q_01760 [Patescibacteria group bacterium]
MNKFPIIAAILTLGIIVGGIFFLTKPSSSNPASSPTSVPADAYLYFWGVGCSHCVVVDEFMKDWSGREKIKIEKFEVRNNRENASLMLEKATTICKIPSNELGTPLLITPENECFIGDTPIIEFFKSLNL